MSVEAQKAYQRFMMGTPSNPSFEEGESTSDSAIYDHLNSLFAYKLQHEPSWFNLTISTHEDMAFTPSAVISGSDVETASKQFLVSLYRDASVAASRRGFGKIGHFRKRLHLERTYGVLGKQSETPDLQNQFAILCREWRAATEIISSSYEITTHPSYLRIIGLGPKVIPLVLTDLRDNGGHWFSALRALTGENPVKAEDVGRVKKMTEAWLQWGRQRDLI